MNVREEWVKETAEVFHRRIERELMTAARDGKNLAVSDTYMEPGLYGFCLTARFVHLDPGASPPPLFFEARPIGWTIFDSSAKAGQTELALEPRELSDEERERFDADVVDAGKDWATVSFGGGRNSGKTEALRRSAPYLTRQERDGSWYVVRGGKREAFGFDKEDEAQAWIDETLKGSRF